MNFTFNLVSLLEEQLRTGSLPSHVSAPFWKVSRWFSCHGSECCLVLCTYSLPQTQNISHNHSWLQAAGACDRPRCSNLLVWGDWVPIWNTRFALPLRVCCLLCVCNPGLGESVYTPKSLSVKAGYHYVGWRLPVPRWEGAPKLWFLSGLCTAAGPCTGYFPFNLQHLLTRWYEAFSVLLGFKTSH